MVAEVPAVMLNTSAKSVTLLACIQKGRDSNLGLKTDILERLRVFPQVL
jgi:hypothetical protein